jgi:hypothetical protein
MLDYELSPFCLGKGLAPTAWSKRYWGLIEDCHAHINFMNTVFADVSCIPELHGAQPTLKLCIILVMAALAEAYGLFATFQPETREKHREAVTGIAAITKTFSDADYPYLDPTIGVRRFSRSRWVKLTTPRFAGPLRLATCTKTRPSRATFVSQRNYASATESSDKRALSLPHRHCCSDGF